MVTTRSSTKTSHTDLESAALSGALKSASSVKAGQKHGQLEEPEIPQKKKAKSATSDVPKKSLGARDARDAATNKSLQEADKPQESTSNLGDPGERKERKELREEADARDENGKPGETTKFNPTDVKTEPDVNAVSDAGKPADINPEVRGPEAGGRHRPTMHASVEDVTDSEPEKQRATHATHTTQQAAIESPGDRGALEAPNGNATATEGGDIDMPDVDTQTPAGVTVSPDRKEIDKAPPMMEKGIVSFFLRAKDEVEQPEFMEDVKRLYMVLRPLPDGAKLVDGKIPDGKNARLIVIPKKKLITKGYEMFLSFLEIPRAGLEELGIVSHTNETKSTGPRTNSPAQRIGEGVYTLSKSSDERQSRFSYILTIPEKPNELQMEFGLEEMGSFVVSVRNSQTPAPTDMNGGMTEKEEYTGGNVLMLVPGNMNGNGFSGNSILDSFEGIKLGPLSPENLGCRNAEILLIGDKLSEEEEVEEEIEILEKEGEQMKHLDRTEGVFADLELRKKELLGMKTTWA